MNVSEKVCKCRLPKTMNPTKEKFESLGFEFLDDGDADTYCSTLPQGWTIQYAGRTTYWILDEKGRRRGTFFTHGQYYGCKNSCMNLFLRYYISNIDKTMTDGKNGFSIVVMNSEEDILFIAGETAYDNTSLIETLKEAAQEYLDTHFPMWKNPMCYWTEE